jgi:putative phosphoesterase
VLRIGLISDTHGLLRPQVMDFLRGCHHILHAGDICDPGIIETLRSLAPVLAVRGNNDRGDWAENFGETATIRFGEIDIHVLHDLSQLSIDPEQLGIRVVVSGHSHKPCTYQSGEVLYVNPGSAGPRRFTLPIAAAELLIEGTTVSVRHQEFLV